MQKKKKKKIILKHGYISSYRAYNHGEVDIAV